MLLKRLFLPSSLVASRRLFYTIPGTNIKKIYDLQEIIDFYRMQNPLNTYSVIHFTAKWNPRCEQTLEAYKDFAGKHSAF